MNFVHANSQECTKSELDLFSIPPTQVSLERGLWVDHQPVSSVADGGPITFLSAGTEDYVDLSKTILVVKAKVTKANGADLIADEAVGVVNNFLHSLFKQVDVFLKEKQVTQSLGTYMRTEHTWRPFSTMVPLQRNLNSRRPCSIKIQPERWTLPILRWPTMPILTLVLRKDMNSIKRVGPSK